MLKSILRTIAILGAFCAATSANGVLPSYEPRFGRKLPVIAVVAYNPATEVTDFVVPYGVLVESGVAHVIAVSTGEGPIQMSAGPRFGAQATLAQFDARHPRGADYVIVPAVYAGENHAPLLAWLREQSRRGATIVGICDGVRTVASAGLLKGRVATTHWRTIDRMELKYPETRWARNTRYIAHGNVITTSGVSASIPISLALVEAIGGRQRAEVLAGTLGAEDWSPRHNSEQFRLTATGFLTALVNKLSVWRHEDLGITVAPGVDEIRVALVADAYHRTRRSPTFTVAAVREPVRTLRGLTVLPDREANTKPVPDRMLSLLEQVAPVQALDRALADIAADYGFRTAALVALSMEYQWKGANGVLSARR
jgi:transcriptional regulator GlxA family with amidase domain